MTGRLVDNVAFMWLRDQRIPLTWIRDCVYDEDKAQVSHTGLHPGCVTGDYHAALAIGLLVPGCQYRLCRALGRDGNRLHLVDALRQPHHRPEKQPSLGLETTMVESIYQPSRGPVGDSMRRHAVAMEKAEEEQGEGSGSVAKPRGDEAHQCTRHTPHHRRRPARSNQKESRHWSDLSSSAPTTNGTSRDARWKDVKILTTLSRPGGGGDLGEDAQ